MRPKPFDDSYYAGVIGRLAAQLQWAMDRIRLMEVERLEHGATIGRLLAELAVLRPSNREIRMSKTKETPVSAQQLEQEVRAHFEANPPRGGTPGDPGTMAGILAILAQFLPQIIAFLMSKYNVVPKAGQEP